MDVIHKCGHCGMLTFDVSEEGVEVIRGAPLHQDTPFWTIKRVVLSSTVSTIVAMGVLIVMTMVAWGPAWLL